MSAPWWGQLAHAGRGQMCNAKWREKAGQMSSGGGVCLAPTDDLTLGHGQQDICWSIIAMHAGN